MPGPAYTPTIVSEKVEYPVRVTVRGEEIYQYSSFNVSRSLGQFVDTFQISVSNSTENKHSLQIMVGDIMSFWLGDIEFFRGLIEKKSVSYQGAESTMSLSGREEIVNVVEDDVDPNVGPFKDTTDNEVIQKMFEGLDFGFELGDGVEVKEYELPSGSVRKAQIVEDILKYGDFYLWKTGRTIKKSLKQLSTPKKRLVFEPDKAVPDNQGRILSLKIEEDISAVRSHMVGFTVQRGKKKTKAEVHMINQNLSKGLYTSSLRNSLSAASPNKINRCKNVIPSSRDETDLKKVVKKELENHDIKAYVNVVIGGLDYVDLMDTVTLYAPIEKINQNLIVETVTYKYEGSNKRSTSLKLVPNLHPIVE